MPSPLFFQSFFLKLLPLYGIVLLGFLAAKRLQVQKESIAKLLLYIITPSILFYGGYTAPLSVEMFSLPIVFYGISCLLCLIFLMIGKHVFRGTSVYNILAFTAGTGNTGYFGLPVAVALFGDFAFSPAVLMALGITLYENSLGFYVAAKGEHTAKEALTRVFKLPGIYLFLLGVFFNVWDVSFGEIGRVTIAHFRGAYTLLGMMMIGMGLSTLKSWKIDFKFVSLALAARSVAWPICVGILIALNKSVLHFYPDSFYPVMVLMGIVPLAANTVSVAVELRVHPDKAALAVLISTLLAMVYVPYLACFL